MATWIAHLRIAEYFIINYNLNKIDFLVGNIAPDSGVPNEDWSIFTPDTKISHWKNDGKNIDANDFLNKYLNKNIPKNDFYLGYYFHLLTDIEWEKLYQKKMLEPIYYENINIDKNFIWTIKKDWYGQDYIFLKNNPNSIFFTEFSKIEKYENTFLEIFPKDAFTQKIKYITNYYKNAEADFKREYLYLSTMEMNSFVDENIIKFEKTIETLIPKL